MPLVVFYFYFTNTSSDSVRLGLDDISFEHLLIFVVKERSADIKETGIRFRNSKPRNALRGVSFLHPSSLSRHSIEKLKGSRVGVSWKRGVNAADGGDGDE